MTDETTSGMGAGFWIFALVVLVLIVVMCMRGGLGLGFGGGMGMPPNVATSGDVQRATDFAALERQNNEGVAATRQGVYDVSRSAAARPTATSTLSAMT